MFLVYIYISPRCKSLPLKKKHDDGTGLVKMQEDPKSSTCCLLHRKVLPFGGLTFILRILKVFWKDLKLSLTANGLSAPPSILWNCQKLKQKLTQIDTCCRSWCMENPPRLDLLGWLVIVSIMVLWLSKCWLQWKQLHFHFPGGPSNQCEIWNWSMEWSCWILVLEWVYRVNCWIF